MNTTIVKKTDWLATVFYPLSVILMEAFWVSPFLNWVGTWPLFRESRPVLNLLSVIILLAAALIITRLAPRLKLPMWGTQTVIIGSGVLAMFLVIAVEYTDGYTFLSGAWFSHLGQLFSTLKNPSAMIAALPVIIYLWWRGIMLGGSTNLFKDIYRSFIIGMAALIALIIIWQSGSMATDAASPGAGLGLNVIAFFFFGLLSIAICHLYVMRSTMPKEDAALTSVWRWMPLMLGIVGGMVVFGFLIASIFSPGMMENLGQGLSTIGGALSQLLQWILTPIFYLVEALIWVARWLLMLLKGETPADTQNMTPGGGGPDFENITGASLPPWVSVMLKWLVLAIVVGLIIFIMARTISRYRAKKAQEQVDEVNESLFSWKGLKDDLKELLNGIGNRFKRKPGAPPSSFDPDAKGRLDIREIFRHLQWEGHKSGVTRYRHETASEYARRLERAVPDSIESIQITRESIGGIKAMYESVRYGETVIPEPQLDKANGFWQTIKGMLRKIRGE
jgi:hypothetical protein